MSAYFYCMNPVWCQPWGIYVAVLEDDAPDNDIFTSPDNGEDWVEPHGTVRLDQSLDAARRKFALFRLLGAWHHRIEQVGEHRFKIIPKRPVEGTEEHGRRIADLKTALVGTVYENATAQTLIVDGFDAVNAALPERYRRQDSIQFALAHLTHGNRVALDAWVGAKPHVERRQGSLGEYLVLALDEVEPYRARLAQERLDEALRHVAEDLHPYFDATRFIDEQLARPRNMLASDGVEHGAVVYDTYYLVYAVNPV